MRYVRKIASWALVLALFGFLITAALSALIGNYAGTAVALMPVALAAAVIAGLNYRRTTRGGPSA